MLRKSSSFVVIEKEDNNNNDNICDETFAAKDASLALIVTLCFDNVNSCFTTVQDFILNCDISYRIFSTFVTIY